MLSYVWVALGGAVGTTARYWLSGVVARSVGETFPWGTLVINASGSLLLGVLTGLALYHAFPKTPKVILGTGFCGAYTTFSTFTFETVGLAEEGATIPALLNAAGMLVVGAACAALGLALATL